MGLQDIGTRSTSLVGQCMACLAGGTRRRGTMCLLEDSTTFFLQLRRSFEAKRGFRGDKVCACVVDGGGCGQELKRPLRSASHQFVVKYWPG